MFKFIDRFIRKNSIHLILFNVLFVFALGKDTSIRYFLTGMNVALITMFLVLFIWNKFRNFCKRTHEPPVYTLNDKLLDAYVFLMSLVLSIIESGDLIGWMKDNLKFVLFIAVFILLELWDKWDDGTLRKWRKNKE